MSEAAIQEKEVASSTIPITSDDLDVKTEASVEASDKQDEQAKPEKKKWPARNRSENKGDGDNKRQKRDRDHKVMEFTPRVDAEGQPLPRSERKPKKKVACMIGYCGTGYNGMQLQPNPDIKTIEGELFGAFARAGAISPENSDDIKKNSFMRCARTDKGVHAAGNVVSLKLIIEDDKIVERINKELPDQIRIWGIQRTSKSFDCRKMCSSRIYEYLLPTYTLLPPKPKTVLANLLEAKNKEAPGIVREDPEGQKWWAETRQAVIDSSGLTAEEIANVESIIEDPNVSSSSNKTYDENGEITEFGRVMRAYKGVENQRRRAYQVSADRLQLFRDAMKMYEGSHNFHNFTLGKSFRDASSRRYMKETTVSDPFIIEGTEWVSIHIHGQSFMLHQIRKMIAMATLVIRTGCPLTRIQDCFGPTKVNVPKAPALGLLLENPVFDGFNALLEKLDYEHIDFTKYSTEIEAFKKKFIYDKIYAEEVRENTYYSFFGFLDSLNNITEDGEKTSGHKHIFDFLGGVYDSGLDEAGKERFSEAEANAILQDDKNAVATANDNVD